MTKVNLVENINACQLLMSKETARQIALTEAIECEGYMPVKDMLALQTKVEEAQFIYSLFACAVGAYGLLKTVKAVVKVRRIFKDRKKRR